VYEIRFAGAVEAELREIQPFYRNILLDQIEVQLAQEPRRLTKNRKLVINLNPPWEAVPPLFELRVGEYRIFYDVDVGNQTVFVRAVRRKTRKDRTKDIL
jgi:mRNA-degrading endonuclease RelE of RelBE toxin-antitoxin system